VRAPLLALLASLPALAQAQPAVPESTSAPVAPGWSPVDEDGWPIGVTLDDVRGLRPCGPGEALPGPGAALTCRPRFDPGLPQWDLQLDWTTAIAGGSDRLTGGAQALGVELGFTLARVLTLGVRYELMGVGLRPEETASSISQRFYGQARYRLFIDEADRSAVALIGGAGLVLQPDALGGDAPVVRLAIAREVGSYLDDDSVVTGALELGAARSFGAPAVSEITASLRLGFELNVAEPRNLSEPRPRESGRLWTSGEFSFLVPVSLGLGASIGARLGRHADVVASAGYAFGRTDDGELAGLHGTWAAQAGLRVDAGWPYLLVQAGPGWFASDDGPDVRLLVDAEIGAEAALGCQSVSLGVRLRADPVDGLDILSGALVLRLALGAGVRVSAGTSCHADHGAYMPTPPRPPEPPRPEPPPASSPAEHGTPALPGGGAVVVEVAPQPIVIDVTLGVVAFGGLLSVSIDPRLLPLARLRGVDADVRVEGPAAALAAYTGELRAVLGRERISVSGWATLATSSQEVHAIFTIYPPGARP
jgi:hypothetical protein